VIGMGLLDQGHFPYAGRDSGIHNSVA